MKDKSKYPKKNKVLVCDFCGKEYLVTTQKYNDVIAGKQKTKACSRDCQHELEKIRSAKERELWPTLICDWCGKEYVVKPFQYKNKKESGEPCFCSHECNNKFLSKKNHEKSLKRREEEYPRKNCEYCGKEMTIYPSDVGKKKYCSRECKRKNRIKKARVTLICEFCGKEFFAKKGDVDFWGGIKFCSKGCRFAARKQGAILICSICGKEYWVHNHDAEKSVCCSRECHAIWQSKIYSQLPEVQERLKRQGLKSQLSMKTEYTEPELKVMQYLIEKEIEYDPQHVIGDVLAADFFLPQYNAVLEVYGDYWHGNPIKYNDGGGIPLSDMQKKNKQKDIKRYKVITGKYGYSFYSVWEYDIKHDLDNAMKKCFEYFDSKIRRESVALQ